MVESSPLPGPKPEGGFLVALPLAPRIPRALEVLLHGFDGVAEAFAQSAYERMLQSMPSLAATDWARDLQPLLGDGDVVRH